MKPVRVSSPLSGLINLPGMWRVSVALLVLALPLAFAAFGGKGGLVNLPGGTTLHMVVVDGTSMGYAVLGELESGELVIRELGPMTEWPKQEPAAEAAQAAAGGPQELENSWLSGGQLVVVKTRITGVGEQAEDLALSRHARLVAKQKQYFPPDP